MNKTDDKIDLLMNKITKLEATLFEEKKQRIKAEDDLDDLNKITIPSLKKQLEDKEEILKEIMIDRIRIEKELSIIKNSLNDQSLSQVGKLIIPEYQDEKDLLVINQSNKIDYYTTVYNQLKQSHNKLKDESAKNTLDYMHKLKIEKEKNEALIKQSRDYETKITSLNNELAVLSNIKSNLCLEIKTVTSIMREYASEKEKYQIESTFFKKEYENQIKTLSDSLTRTKRLDGDYQVLVKTLEEYKTRLSEMDTKTYIFNVVSIGAIIENAAEIVFNKEGANRYYINIKYMTSSSKYDIIELEDVIQIESEENIIEISYKKEKGQAPEQFRTTEGDKIIKVFKDFQKRAHQHMDVRKLKKNEKHKETNIKKNMKNMFSMFD